MRRYFSSISLILIALVLISLNVAMVLRFKAESISEKPLKMIDSDKPTLLIIFNEYECQSCVNHLSFLTDIYSDLEKEGIVTVRGLLLSETTTDKKGISELFPFPFAITDDFSILIRLNIRETPLILGLSADNEILYYELIPRGTGIDVNYLKKGVLQRLYYSARTNQ